MSHVVHMNTAYTPTEWEYLFCKAKTDNNLIYMKTIVSHEPGKIHLKLGRKEWPSYFFPLEVMWRNSDQDASEMIRFLVAAGIDINSYAVNIREGERRTVLHEAVYQRRIQIVRLLLELGADVSLQGKWISYCGTALEWAWQLGLNEIGKVLQEEASQKLSRTEQELNDAIDIQRELDLAITLLEPEELWEVFEEEKHEQGQPTSSEAVAKVRCMRKKPGFQSETHIVLLRERLSILEVTYPKGLAMMDAELDYLSHELAALKEEMGRLKRQHPFNLRSQAVAAQLAGRLSKARALSASMKVLATLPYNAADLRSCALCLQKAEVAFSCPECENWFCGGCKKKVVACPRCREDFLKRPPVRNRGIERALGL